MEQDPAIATREKAGAIMAPLASEQIVSTVSSEHPIGSLTPEKPISEEITPSFEPGRHHEKRNNRTSLIRRVGSVLLASVAVGMFAPGEARADSVQEFKAHTKETAAALFKDQEPSGNLKEATGRSEKGRYGNNMAAYSGLLEADQSRNSALRRKSVKALYYGTRKVEKSKTPVDPFNLWAVTASYNLLNKNSLRKIPYVRQALKRSEKWIKKQRYTYLNQGDNFQNNKKLIEVLGVYEGLKTGIKSSIPNTIFKNRRLAKARADRYMNRTIPAMAKGSAEVIISDPGAFPHAYGDLVYGTAARIYELRGKKKGILLQQMGRAIGKVVTPDGDPATHGRSAGHSWNAAAAMYGNLISTKTRGSSSAADYTSNSLAHRFWERIKSIGVGPRAEWLTPALKQNFNLGMKGEDDYVRTKEYSALKLAFMNLAKPHLPRIFKRGQIPADSNMQAIVGKGTGRTASIRKGGLFYLIKETVGGEGKGIGDQRYDFGIVAAMRRGANGVWNRMSPWRPKGSGSGGPVLMSPQGPAYPSGNSISASPDGVVRIKGAYKLSNGHIIRPNVNFVFEPTPDQNCLKSSVEAQPGDQIGYTAYFSGLIRPSISGNWIKGANGQAVGFNFVPAKAAEPKIESSSSDAIVTSQRILVKNSGATKALVSMAVCKDVSLYSNSGYQTPR